MVVHLNGMPGCGKLTMGRLLAEQLGAELVDNHSLINPVSEFHAHGSPAYAVAVQEATRAALARGGCQVFTNALAAEIERDRLLLDEIAQAAAPRGFLQVLLRCELAENQRRVVGSDRAELCKLTDPAALEQIHQVYTLYHPPAARRLELDVTRRSAEETARLILAEVRP